MSDELRGEDALEQLEGETVEEATFDLGSVVLELENGSRIKLYDQSGIGVDPVVEQEANDE